jgi:hypothetical protein
MKKLSVQQIITILVTTLTIIVNVLANALPINGQGTGEISDRFAIYFVPAGYVFSIWGLIYLGLIAFTIYQALPGQRGNSLIERISPAYWIANLANTAWIFLWHYEFFPSTLIAMLTILAALIIIDRQLASARDGMDRNQKWFIQNPVSIYLGWISVATIANFSQVLFFINWSGWGITPEVWTVIMLAVATLLGVIMYWREKAWPFVFVLIWALVGIALKQSASMLVSNTAWAGSGFLGLALLMIPFIKKRGKRKSE